MAAISPPTALFCGTPSAGRAHHQRLAETNNEPGEPRQVPRKLGSTDADGKWQRGSPTAANDEKTQTVTGHKRRAPMAATDAPNNASNLQAAVQHNADKEKEKPVEATCGPG